MIVALLLCVLAPASAQAAAAPAPVPAEFFGVSGRSIDDADVTQMREAGVGTYRALFHFRWAKRRRTDHYRWGAFDRLVGRMATAGIELLPLLYGTPRWIYSDEATPPIHDATAATEWVRLLRQLAGRYGPDGLYWKLNPLTPYRPIRAWQIWNEPNSPRFWGPTVSPADYAKLLQISAQAIHAIDPGAAIVTAGVAADPTGDGAIRGPDYLASLARIPGVAHAADKFAYHPYAANAAGVLKEISTARKALRSSGHGRAPLWITEFGWGANSLLDSFLAKTEDGQAAALGRSYSRVLAKNGRLGVERMLWYYWRDQFDPLCIWCRSAGLLQRWREPRPAFETFQRLAFTAAR
jgi:hypothetical protein